MTGKRSQNAGIENLIVGHFDGTLNPDQEKELATSLAESANTRQLFLSHMRLEGRLQSLGRDGFLRDPVSEPVIDDSAIGREWPTSNPTSVSLGVPANRQRLSLLAASSLAVCVAAILMVLSNGLWPSSVSASTVLQKARQAAAELIDRTYRVTLLDAGERTPSSELTINVRGGGRFLVRPVGEAYAIGSDGTEYWATRAGGPAWVTTDSRSLVPKLKRTIPSMWLFSVAASPNEPLLLDMAGMLSLISRKHDVELVESEVPAEHHMRATLKAGRATKSPNTPTRIDFWVDANTGVALRSEVRWSDGRRMRFELVDSVTLSDQWYHHSKHVNGDIERIEAARQL